MNFAPYQDESPETERALSPPIVGSRIKSPALRSPRASADLPSPSHFGHGNTGFGRDVEGGHVSLGAFETSLPIRMDIEAMLGRKVFLEMFVKVRENWRESPEFLTQLDWRNMAGGESQV